MLAIILLILFLIFFTSLAWKNLLWATTFIVAFLPSYLVRFSIGAIPTTLLEIMIFTLFIVWLIKFKVENEKFKITIQNLKLKNWWLLIIAWLIVATISMLVSPNLRAAAGVWKAYFIEPILLLFIFLNVVKEKKDLELIFYALGFSALYISAFAIYQKFTGLAIPNPTWQAAETRRVTSFYGYPNAIGLYLAPIVTLSIGLLLNEILTTKYKIKNKKTLLVTGYWLLVTLTSLAAIIFARSEGAYAGILAGVFFLGVMIKKLRWPTVTLATLLVIIILFTPQFKNYVWQQITFQTDSGKVRLIQWQETWEMLKNRPILGAGLAGYQKTFAPHHKAKHIEIYLYPHNLFLNFWSEIGLGGLIIFLFIVTKFFKDNIKKLLVTHCLSLITNRWLLIIISASMFTLLIHGLVDVAYFKNDLSILFWLIIGSSLVISNLTKSSKTIS